MNYTIHQLAVFLKISQTNSITKAAEELHLTQPAISIQLKKFQEQFDLPLTEIIRRRLYITDFGKEIAIAAENILDELEAINNRMLSYKKQLTGRLKISVVSTGKYIMPYFLADFLQDNPGIQLQLDVTNKSRVLESLEKNEIDFALLSVLPDYIKLNKVELMTNQLFLVCNEKQKIKKSVYDKSIFENIPLIYREPGSGTRHAMEKYIEKNKLSVIKKLELTSNEAVKQAVIAGLGYSIMPLIGLKNELINKDLKLIQVKGFPIKSVWNLVWQKNKNLSPVALAYMEYIRKEKSNIIHDKFQWFEQYSNEF